jgi:hypothetical protein
MTVVSPSVIRPAYRADAARVGAWTCLYCGWRPIIDRDAHTRAHNAALIIEQEYDPDDDYEGVRL